MEYAPHSMWTLIQVVLLSGAFFCKQSSSRDTCGSDLPTTKAAQSDQWPHKGE